MKFSIPTKRTGSFTLPVLGLGTWQMGGRYTQNIDNDDDRDISAIQEAIQNGITHIDTAEIYAAGYTEELVGKAIKDFKRESLFITTKVRPEHLHYADVLQAAKMSMKRLRTEYLDLYLIHSPNPSITIVETMQALDELLETGIIRNIGVSNFNIEEIEEAQAAAKHKIVTNQIHFSLSARQHEEAGVLDYCAKKGILVTAYRPLSKGELAMEDNELLDKMATKYGKTSAQIAINWVISQPNVVALFKASNLEHLDEDLGALGFQMSDQDVATLSEQFPRGETISSPVDRPIRIHQNNKSAIE